MNIINGLNISTGRTVLMYKYMKNLGTNHDGYHTFDELYEHRHMLYLNLIKGNKSAWKSKLHQDGTMFEGWFISGMTLETGMAITYHLPMKYWMLCSAWETSVAPEWDGHSPQDVCDRLLRNL